MIIEEKIINLSKKKIFLLTFGSIFFVGLGFWMVSFELKNTNDLLTLENVTIEVGIGVLSIIFCGACGLFGIKKLFDSSPGLILNQEGIIDNSSGVAVGKILWSDILSIEKTQIGRQKFVSVIVKDPEKYANYGNFIQRFTNKANMKLCSTPINISSISLCIDQTELYSELEFFFLNK